MGHKKSGIQPKRSAKNNLPSPLPPPAFQHFLDKYSYVTDRNVIDFSSNFLKHLYGHQVAKNDANLAISPMFRQVSTETPL
ncbi:hypothetical protein TNCV_2288531 [Trichonephila clavipes]|nr:hypothetical protein TNCV_2288531 [Trichonephila clavipes]